MQAVLVCDDEELSVPLSKLQPLDDTDGQSSEAILDWLYWTGRG